MNKKTFLIIEEKKFSISIFDKNLQKDIFFKEYECQINLNLKHLDLTNINKIIEENIFEIEKTNDEFLEDIYLLIDLPESQTIDLSLDKEREGDFIQTKDIKYLVQDAKQQILRSYLDNDIIHIIIGSYVINNNTYNFLPPKINCKKFAINIKFVCFPKKIIKELKKLFHNHQIRINQILSFNYIKSFAFEDLNIGIGERAFKIINGFNKQEVIILPKKDQKQGFFEKLFHLFK